MVRLPLAMVATAAALFFSTPQRAGALENTDQLSFLLFHKVYPTTQGYLVYNNDNPTWDKRHAGYDFGTGAGTIIYSPVSGVCIKSGGTLGYCSIYSKTLDRTVIFLHLSRVDVQEGSIVHIGQVLGLTGTAGVPSRKAHAHVECRPGSRPFAVGSSVAQSTASQTINPLLAFADPSIQGAVLYKVVDLAATDPNNWYRIYSLSLFGPGELTAIAKCGGTLDADLWYSWDGGNWYPLSATDGNEFLNLTLGSGYGTAHYPIYVAVVAYTGSGRCEFMWHATQSAP